MSPEMGRYTLQDDIPRMAAHVAVLDAHHMSHLEQLRIGGYFQLPEFTATASTPVVANTLYAVPFFVARTMTFDRIQARVEALAGGTTGRLGIYNNGVNFYPGTLLLDAGTIDTGANGNHALVIAQQLTRGWYWLAFVCNGAPTMRYSTLGISPLGFGDAMNVMNCGWSVAFVFAALPDPFTAGGVLVLTSCITIALRLLSLD